jgi:hypothetical protein
MVLFRRSVRNSAAARSAAHGLRFLPADGQAKSEG